MATDLLPPRRRLTELDKATAAASDQHPQAAIIKSLPGMGSLVGAEFAVAVGDLTTFPSLNNLAAYAGLAPEATTQANAAATFADPTATAGDY
jgi:transposase